MQGEEMHQLKVVACLSLQQKDLVIFIGPMCKGSVFMNASKIILGRFFSASAAAKTAPASFFKTCKKPFVSQLYPPYLFCAPNQDSRWHGIGIDVSLFG